MLGPGGVHAGAVVDLSRRRRTGYGAPMGLSDFISALLSKPPREAGSAAGTAVAGSGPDLELYKFDT